jgi:hypothetical protein
LGGGKDRKGGEREGDRQEGGQTGRGKGKETNREGGKIESRQREGRKGRKGGGRAERQGEADRQWGLIRCSSAVGGRLCLWALAVCRHALGRSRRWGVVASKGARIRGWGSFLSVGGCCVCGRSRLRVGVAFEVLLVSGVLLWGGFVVVGAFRFPAAGVVCGRSSFVGGGWSSGVDNGGGVVLARSGCDMALPRHCRPSLRRPVLSGSFWFSLTIVASRRHSALVLVGDVALARRVAVSSSTVVADVLGCAVVVVVVVVGGRWALWAVAWWCGSGGRRWGGERWGCWRLRKKRET